MALAHTFTFEKRLGNASKGQLLLEIAHTPDITDTYPILVLVEVVGPSGETIKAYPSEDAPDFTIASGETHEVAIVPIEKDSITNLDLPGDYVINTKVKKGAGSFTASTDINDTTLTFAPIGTPQATLVPTIESVVNCITKKVTVTDSASYTGYTVTNYELKLTPPVIPGVSLSTSTTTLKVLTANLQYTNVSYTASVYADVAYNVYGDDGDTIYSVYNDTIQATLAVPITCPANICDFVECVQSALAALESEACQYGGINKLSLQKQSDYFKLQHNSLMLLAGQGCGSSTMVNTAIANLEDLVECDCGCSGTTPKAIGGGTSSDVGEWISVANGSLANSWVNGTNSFQYRRYNDFIALRGTLKRTAITGATSSSLFGSTNPIHDTSGMVLSLNYRIPITDLTTGLQVGYISRGGTNVWTAVTFANFSGANNNFIDAIAPLEI